MNRYLPWVAALALTTGLTPVCIAAYTATADTNATALGQVYVGDKDPVIQGLGDQQRDVVQAGTARANAATGLHTALDSADAAGGGNSWAQVAAGGIRLQATAVGSALFLTPGNTDFARIIGRSNAYAAGSFSDGLTFFMPGVAPGAPLAVTFSVNVTASLGGNGQFSAGLSGFSTVTEMRWQVALGNLSDGRTETEYNSNGETSRGAAATGLWTFTSTVSNGVATTLAMEASAGAAAQGGINCRGCGLSTIYAEGLSNADFSHTLAWNGIQGVTDAGGNVLDLGSLQVLSSSGADYLGAWTAPVPELSSAWLMAAGLLALLAGLRPRRALRPRRCASADQRLAE
ncbi:MAG: hypothetical protein ACT6S0_19410 [Roseateles sp.]|uniref:hypothetical protein n=1 Tax=Roseateles sp. TaxID=1971397 RepID=UPI004036BE40